MAWMEQLMKTRRSLGEFGLFLDVDGTLVDIAPNPDAVVVPRSLIRALELAEHRFEGALALVSGRTIQDLDRLFAPLRLKASGVHGAEFRFNSRQGTTLTTVPPLPMQAWTDLLDLLEAFPGTLAENKAFSFAVHYRSVPPSGPALERALQAFMAARRDLALRILPGHFVFELKRPNFDKGVAIERFLDKDPFKGRRPIFIGDDVTDEPGFDTVIARHGLAYSVNYLAPGVIGTFRDPAAVRRWLTATVKSETVTA